MDTPAVVAAIEAAYQFLQDPIGQAHSQTRTLNTIDEGIQLSTESEPLARLARHALSEARATIDDPIGRSSAIDGTFDLLAEAKQAITDAALTEPLISQITEQNNQAFIDFDPPVGREII